MNILELRAAHRGLFCPQVWYEGEKFAVRHLPVRLRCDTPRRVRPCRDGAPPKGARLVPAVALVAAFVSDPEANIWRDYLWTADHDRLGQRVYVGGTANGRGFEIHRHLHLTERWGIPIWR